MLLFTYFLVSDMFTSRLKSSKLFDWTTELSVASLVFALTAVTNHMTYFLHQLSRTLGNIVNRPTGTITYSRTISAESRREFCSKALSSLLLAFFSCEF